MASPSALFTSECKSDSCTAKGTSVIKYGNGIYSAHPHGKTV